MFYIHIFHTINGGLNSNISYTYRGLFHPLKKAGMAEWLRRYVEVVVRKRASSNLASCSLFLPYCLMVRILGFQQAYACLGGPERPGFNSRYGNS